MTTSRTFWSWLCIAPILMFQVCLPAFASKPSPKTCGAGAEPQSAPHSSLNPQIQTNIETAQQTLTQMRLLLDSIEQRHTKPTILKNRTLGEEAQRSFPTLMPIFDFDGTPFQRVLLPRFQDGLRNPVHRIQALYPFQFGEVSSFADVYFNTFDRETTQRRFQQATEFLNVIEQLIEQRHTKPTMLDNGTMLSANAQHSLDFLSMAGEKEDLPASSEIALGISLDAHRKFNEAVHRALLEGSPTLGLNGNLIKPGMVNRVTILSRFRGSDGIGGRGRDPMLFTNIQTQIDGITDDHGFRSILENGP